MQDDDDENVEWHHKRPEHNRHPHHQDQHHHQRKGHLVCPEEKESGASRHIARGYGEDVDERQERCCREEGDRDDNDEKDDDDEKEDGKEEGAEFDRVKHEHRHERIVKCRRGELCCKNRHGKKTCQKAVWKFEKEEEREDDGKKEDDGKEDDYHKKEDEKKKKDEDKKESAY